LTLMSRILRRFPTVQRLEKECDRLRSEQNSALLRARSISAKMGVLDAQVRTMQNERIREAEKVRNLTAEHQSIAAQLRVASEACGAMTQERDTLAVDRGALIAQRDEAIHKRDQLARELDRCRQDAPFNVGQ